MEIAVKNIQGKDTGKTVNLNDSVFGVEVNEHALYLEVKQILANKRAGTHKAKERGEVSRTTKKFKKQKGTGSARAGSLRSPIFKGGGTIFGPRPRKYDFKLNKKLKRVARKSALSARAQKNEIVVVEDFTIDAVKTKNMVDIFASLGATNKKTLLVLPESNKNVYLSCRNLPKTKVVIASDINTYDILNSNNLILSEGSIEKIENILS